MGSFTWAPEMSAKVLRDEEDAPLRCFNNNLGFTRAC